MTTAYYDYYDGSKIFLFLSNKVGLPLDLVNFLIAQVAALCLARLFRKPLKFASPEFRHSVCLVIGLLMGYFCFGKWRAIHKPTYHKISLTTQQPERFTQHSILRLMILCMAGYMTYLPIAQVQAIHLSVVPMLCYTLLKTVPHHLMGNAILTASMVYLSCLHLHRQIYHTADYTLDITGPLMVITQRVTSLAYSLQDNLTNKEVNANTKEADDSLVTIEKIPSPLEFFAYTLAFQTLMCGPVVFYNDYINFIEGERWNENDKSKENIEPSPRRAVFYKMMGSISAALLYLTLAKKYPLTVLEELTDPSSEVSRSWSGLYLLWYAYLSTLVVRCKYYHAWLLSEAICNNSGMGFNGYDNDGTPKWDKMSNIDVFGFEFAQNFRTAISSWNKNTNAWLRNVAYRRGGATCRTVRVYGLSAVWHGFHPGYYMTFFAGGLFTVAARKFRMAARPLFVNSRPKKLFYDLLSFITTRVAMTYATVPFVLLHLTPSLAFYGNFYYSLHFIALGALLLPARTKCSTHVQSDLQQKSSITSNDHLVRATNGDTNGKLKIT